MICSDQNWTPGHRVRAELAQSLKNHFGDRLDWFGKGTNPIPTKWDGLVGYERTIVLENRNSPAVFSEKILDPFLTLTQPIYSGAPDIESYFPVNETHQLNPLDIRGSIRKIEKILSKPLSNEEIASIIAGRDAALSSQHFLKRAAAIAKSKAAEGLENKASVSLKPRSDFGKSVSENRSLRSAAKRWFSR